MRRTRRVRCVTSRAPGKHDTPSSSISFHTLPVLLPCQQRSSSMRVLRPDVTRRSTSSISLSISFYLFRFEIYLIFFPKKISVSRPPHEWCKNPSKKKKKTKFDIAIENKEEEKKGKRPSFIALQVSNSCWAAHLQLTWHQQSCFCLKMCCWVAFSLALISVAVVWWLCTSS